MKIAVVDIVEKPHEYAFTRGNGSLWIVRCTVRVDGGVLQPAAVKLFDRNDVDKVRSGADLSVIQDPRRREGEPETYLLEKSRENGGRGRFSGGGVRRMDSMQFLLDQRGKMAIAALEQAVEMRKGTAEKVIPLADEMFAWLRDKSMIGVEEQKAGTTGERVEPNG